MIRRASAAAGALLMLASIASAQGRTVTITTSDYQFDAPDSIAAGIVTFELVNKGPELHHVQILRLDQGKTMDDFGAAMKNPGPPPAWVSFIGGPNAPIPDGKTTTSVTATLKAGNYVIICMVPSPDGTPHVMKGMVRPLRVTKATGVMQAGAPKADAVLTLYDYNFDFDKPLTAGKHTIRIRNTSPQFHEAFLAKLPPNTSAWAVPDWVHGGMKGPPPAIPMGGITGINPGQENILMVDLEPGDYALYCFMPDSKDGKEHVTHGMVKKFTVQ